MGTNRLAASAWALVFFFAAPATKHFAQEVRPWIWIQESPSLPPPHKCDKPYVFSPVAFHFPVGCYDVTKGRWKNCETLWMEYFSLAGIEDEERLLWTGGHEHDRSAGEVDVAMGILYSPLDLSGGSDPTMFYGMTNFQVWNAIKTMPEASGVIRVFARYTIADRSFRFYQDDLWHYDTTDPTHRTVVSEIAFVVGVRGLEELPDSEEYVKDSRHPGHTAPVFCGTPEMNDRLAALAGAYREWCSSQGQTCRISFNDLSLRYGGLFDYRGDWQCPHVLHREGRSADVNPGSADKDILDELAKSSSVGLIEKHTGPADPLIHYEWTR